MSNYGVLKTVYNIEEKDEFLKTITFKCPEALSLGSRCVITLEDSANESVVIKMEMQRVIGSYNESAEVSWANTHIKNLAEYISFLLEHQDSWPDKMFSKWGKTEYDLTPEEKEVLEEKKKKSNKIGQVVLLIVAILLLALMVIGKVSANTTYANQEEVSIDFNSEASRLNE